MAHEDLTRLHAVERSSDRNFGLVVGAAFLVVAVAPIVHAEPLRWWALGLALLFGGLAAWKPALLTKLNILWTKLGMLLGNIVAPVALGVLFYAVLAPVGFVMKLAGKDPLRLKREPDAKTYWIQREPPGPPPDSMTNQF